MAIRVRSRNGESQKTDGNEEIKLPVHFQGPKCVLAAHSAIGKAWVKNNYTNRHAHGALIEAVRRVILEAQTVGYQDLPGTYWGPTGHWSAGVISDQRSVRRVEKGPDLDLA